MSSKSIDWSSQESHIFLNPKMHSYFPPDSVMGVLPSFAGHIWLSTSGTSSPDQLKLVALSKKAFCISSQAVNDHLQASSKDIWLNVLPDFHVGGLAIFTRSWLMKCMVFVPVNWKWSPMAFVDLVEETKATLSSLVPTQIFDLVQSEVRSPESLRAVVVGGGHLSPLLYQKARALGWPLLPSYGLTECCSQVATAPLSSLASVMDPLPLARLNHVKLHTNGEGRLMINSGSLLSAYAIIKEDGVEIFDPKDGGWFVTEDLAELNGDYVTLKGRKDDRVKISGELVDLFSLNRQFIDFVHMHSKAIECQLIATPSERLGHQVDVAAPMVYYGELESLVSAFNKKVSGVEAIKNIYYLRHWPLTALGKLQTPKVLSEIGFEHSPNL